VREKVLSEEALQQSVAKIVNIVIIYDFAAIYCHGALMKRILMRLMLNWSSVSSLSPA
jgi:hypothetical protein